MSSSAKSFIFTIVLCVLVSVLLTAAATNLKPYQVQNVQLDMQKNILRAIGVVEAGKKYTKQDVMSLYDSNISDKWVDSEGLIHDEKQEGYLPIYLYMEPASSNNTEATLKGYVLPTSGYGLWSTIYGFIGLKGDGRTVAGFTVYQHGETPGLGGEVEMPWFQNQFVGKSIVDAEGRFTSVRVVKGKAADTVPEDQLSHTIDGMSGATITTRGVDAFLKRDLERYDMFSKRLREQ